MREGSLLYCPLQTEVHISVHHPHPSQSFLFFLCTHPLISLCQVTNVYLWLSSDDCPCIKLLCRQMHLSKVYLFWDSGKSQICLTICCVTLYLLISPNSSISLRSSLNVNFNLRPACGEPNLRRYLCIAHASTQAACVHAYTRNTHTTVQ